ncbi:orotate phosphoribosyltransferase [Loa loa]|uniref:Uridine 5'-monophosphate synthase n=1 Tax=Loa loa TaxID=7209 RepID=A0A1I7VR59_LOALO|nr:orotate phosphoribosyltransferase [Loa loa]EFO27244.1 orotate phosphoribosyltransferase [Loa loa]
MSGAGDMINERLLLKELKSAGVFKLGNFTLQSGQISPIYVDLRVLFTLPKVLSLTANCMCTMMEAKNLKYDYIVGVPYAALPLSTIIADRLEKPMLLRRKEVKSYGTRKIIEGKYEAGKRALVIEDVVTSGKSILETVLALRSEGLICEDAICVLDREQGGPQNVQDEGLTLYSLLGMNKVLDFLIDIGIITAKRKEDILYQLTLPPPTEKIHNHDWSLTSRENSTPNALNKRLLEIMNKKKTCLCIAIDITKCEDIIQIVEKTAGYICAVKLHADVIEDFSDAFVRKLTSLANNLDFIIFEDRKLADTGYTTNLQLTKGPFKIASWAQIVSVHALSGQPVLNVIRKIVDQPKAKLTGCLLVVEMSSGAFINSKQYLDDALELAKSNRDIVSGFICQKRCTNIPGFLYWTSGVHMDAMSDGIGQNWRTIENAIGVDGNDIVVVGRAITGAADINTQIRRYRDATWESYINRQQNH